MRPSTRRFLFALLAAALLAAAARLVHPINSRRVSDHLVTGEIPEAAQPGFMLGPLLALGRAPLVDYLWLRAMKLKDEGRYFDAYQLAETICHLQPRFASVWVFNAWNMAYNISVTLRSPEERWRWVKNGIELLRDQGIPRNPRNVQMYKELAWIFFHKVGDFLDDQHWYYKLQLALMMEDILGPGGSPDYAALAAAPRAWDDLVRDADVAAVAQKFAALGEDVSLAGVFLGLLSRENPPEALADLLADPVTAPARKRIEAYWRAKRLREEVRLEPARIVELREAYGPLDFRLAEAHALYWASLGVELATDKRTALDIDRLNASRIELYCLKNFFRGGRLVMSPSARLGEPPMLLPDVRFADNLRRAFIAVSKDYIKQESEGVVSTNFQSAMINFMREAVVRFNEAGDLARSHEYFDWLVENYPDPLYDAGYEAFILKEALEDREFTQFRVAQHRIEMLIARAVRLIAYGEFESGAASIAYARRLWARYEKQQVHNRQRLPPFDQMYEYVVHELGSRMRPETYERLLKQTGFTKPSATQSAVPSNPP